MESLKIHNSLQPGSPVPFKPIEAGKVSWYACGPTVYDKSHLGHARNYVSTDIIRRILMHYFGFRVRFVMNMTDVDDKIIIKARRQRLLELEKKKTHSLQDLRALAVAAFQAYAKSNLPLLTADDNQLDEKNYTARRDAAYKKVLAGSTLSGEGKPGDGEAKIKMHLGNMDAAARALADDAVFPGADEVLLPYLDSLYKETIDTRDQSMFTDLTKSMEDLFTQDMDNLNVLRPDVITRVTEYMPQIVKFVEQIVDKGFAYEAQGSVYFDIAAFEKAGNKYARLRPDGRNDKSLQDEGEGSLSKNLAGKKGAGDFALWKRSKAGEPFWTSKWGDGRPGWHIECSVMASDILGSRMDIHSGGIDLAFPHHDNELAQSEAFFCEGGQHTWVNYFLHMGHLSISGSKMSKSLKNFQTIQDALATSYTARSMRIVFLMGKWNDGVEISPDMRAQADNWEATISNFFTNTKAWLAEADDKPKPIDNGVKKLYLDDNKLMADLDQAKDEVESALLNSFDTPRAMLVMLKLVNSTNAQLKDRQGAIDLSQVEAIARWITKMVGIFGLDANAQPPYDGLGWVSSLAADVDAETAVRPYAAVLDRVRADVTSLSLSNDRLSTLVAVDPSAESRAAAEEGTRDIEKLALPYLRAVSHIRDELRRTLSTQPPTTKKQVLSLTDAIRDDHLSRLGVYLDDRPDSQPALIKFVPAADLLAAREEKAAREADKARQKEEARLAREKADKEARDKARVPPEDMFRGDERYGEWDGQGLPTRMRDGSDVPKSQMKALKKMWEKQKRVHEELKAKGGL